MTYEEALEYSRKYGTRARQLARKSMDGLRLIHGMALRNAGQAVLWGKFSKDELIAEILKLEYPDIREADQIRAAALLGEEGK